MTIRMNAIKMIKPSKNVRDREEEEENQQQPVKYFIDAGYSEQTSTFPEDFYRGRSMTTTVLLFFYRGAENKIG